MAFTGTYLIETKQKLCGSENAVSSGSSQHEKNSLPNSNEFTKSTYPGVLDTELTSLTAVQRNIFIVTLMTLFVLSMCGNLCTLSVNFRRKIRPFFRACLISLALSDLLNTVFITTAYMSQFTPEYVQVWHLGSLMCSLVPFATTAAILASSMTLVGIAVDRYYAVMKAVNGFWNPSVICCIVCMFCIWLASTAISCPVFTIYDLQPVYILKEEHENANVTVWSTTTALPPNEVASAEIQTPWELNASLEDLSYTLVREEKLVNMCLSDQNVVTLYYLIVFVIIFIPCIGAFFWFNSVLARKLWKRRHSAGISRRKSPKSSKIKSNTKSNSTSINIKLQNPQLSQTLQQKSCNCRSGHSSGSTMPSSLSNTLEGNTTAATATCSTSNNTATTTTNVNANNSREARHLRMFTIILLMMAAFMLLRLPAWIFLLMRMYGSYTKHIHWILYFIFGIMNLASSVLNPLFYTFLTETIQCVLKLKAKVKSVFCCGCSRVRCCRQYGRYGSKNNTSNSSTTSNNPPRIYGRCQPPVILENVDEPLTTLSCCEHWCDFIQAPWKCYQPKMEAEHQQQIHPQVLHVENEIGSKDSGQALNNEKDEGVDCSDEVDDEVRDFYDYNDRIYTIFPSSLVSSSINSQ